MKRRNRLVKGFVLVVLSIALITLTAALQSIRAHIRPRTAEQLMIYARQVLQTCATEGHKTSCYTREIPRLMKQDRLTMEDAFTITKHVQERDPQFLYCHVLGHELSFIESQRNRADWKNILSRCPLAMCNYGCLHGSLVEHFRGEILSDEEIARAIPDLSDVCEERENFTPTPLDKTMCYHALGHLSIYITDGDPARAIPICEQIATKPDGRDYTQTCVEGVFMTVFQGIDPEDIALVADIKPEPEDIPQFCSGYGKYWVHCRRESYAMYLNELKEPSELVKFCSYATGEAMETDCYLTVLNIVAVNAFERGGGVTSVEKYCRQIPYERRDTCYAGVAMRLVQIDPRYYAPIASDVCALGETEGLTDECYNGVIQYAVFSFTRGDEAAAVYCSHLPDPWEARCLQRIHEES